MFRIRVAGLPLPLLDLSELVSYPQTPVLPLRPASPMPTTYTHPPELPITMIPQIPRTEEPGRLQSMGSLGVGHNWATSLSLFTSCVGEGNGNPLQYSCLEDPRDGGAWCAAIYGVAQSWTRLKRLSSFIQPYFHSFYLPFPLLGKQFALSSPY